ncbi:MAG: hypothetical protein HUU28_17195, partial [Planctomycetaceae bacterium]|nr:hypothetical protein [Planctomycetaceae bacterium]
MLSPTVALLALAITAQEPTPLQLPVLPHAQLQAELAALSGTERLFVGKSSGGRAL